MGNQKLYTESGMPIVSLDILNFFLDLRKKGLDEQGDLYILETTTPDIILEQNELLLSHLENIAKRYPREYPGEGGICEIALAVAIDMYSLLDQQMFSNTTNFDLEKETDSDDEKYMGLVKVTNDTIIDSIKSKEEQGLNKYLTQLYGKILHENKYFLDCFKEFIKVNVKSTFNAIKDTTFTCYDLLDRQFTKQGILTVSSEEFSKWLEKANPSELVDKRYSK